MNFLVTFTGLQGQIEGAVACSDHRFPVCECWVGVDLTNYFFRAFFFFSGWAMVLVSLRFVHGMSPMGGGAQAGLWWAPWWARVYFNAVEVLSFGSFVNEK